MLPRPGLQSHPAAHIGYWHVTVDEKSRGVLFLVEVSRAHQTSRSCSPQHWQQTLCADQELRQGRPPEEWANAPQFSVFADQRPECCRLWQCLQGYQDENYGRRGPGHRALGLCVR